jgi:hypothetical protein
MKRFMICLCVLLSITALYAGEKDKHLTINAGVMAPNTLDAIIGFDFPIGYNQSIEAFAEAGDHWHTPICCQFWKSYYWDAGASYKYRIKRFKNGALRFAAGLHCGMSQKIFFGVNAGFEYNYVLPNNWVLTIQERNELNFLNGDRIRAGGLIGIKIPF